MKTYKTIWHYAIAFFETKGEMELANINDVAGKPFYMGEIAKLSYQEACKIAQIHPRALAYYEAAMMPLFQGQGKLRSGTESPVRALESLKTKAQREKNMPYILIWRIFTP